MAKEKVYADGLMTFPKNEKAPDFVLGTLIITPNKLHQWMKDNPQYVTEYKGEKQLKLTLLQGQGKVNIQVDTYQPKQQKVAEPNSDLPF